MYSLDDFTLESNKKIKFNFDGGDLSSDAGLLLINEFIAKMGLDKLIDKAFKTNDSAKFRIHEDGDNLLQVLYQILSAYFTDDCADELTSDPVFTTILDKPALASQPTLSRFYNRLDRETLYQLDEICRALRRTAYSIAPPKMVLFDLDSTLLETYGKQEGEAFNFHYQARGYHPLLCYDGLTRDLLKVELRKGSDHCSNGIAEFVKPLLDEYQKDYPDIDMFLRGDSGFATPELYSLCETNGVAYAIKLKSNKTLQNLASGLLGELGDLTKENIVSYAVVYGEFLYQAGTWEYPRRVVCIVEKKQDQMFPVTSYIVTNMDMSPEDVVMYYRNRGCMENFIKEGKGGFDFAAVSSSSEIVNANRFQIHALAYNIFNYFRRFALPESMKNHMVDTIRLKLMKVAAKLVRSGRYFIFKLCSSFAYKREFCKTLENIRCLRPQLA